MPCETQGAGEMKGRVYIETTIISYLTARPSRDLVVAAHQELTLEWWASHRERFDLYVSDLDRLRQRAEIETPQLKEMWNCRAFRCFLLMNARANWRASFWTGSSFR